MIVLAYLYLICKLHLLFQYHTVNAGNHPQGHFHKHYNKDEIQFRKEEGYFPPNKDSLFLNIRTNPSYPIKQLETLGSEGFDDFIYNSKKPIALLFYAHYCSASKQFAKNYVNYLNRVDFDDGSHPSSASSSTSKITFAAIDCGYLEDWDDKLKHLRYTCYKHARTIKTYKTKTKSGHIKSISKLKMTYPTVKLINQNLTKTKESFFEIIKNNVDYRKIGRNWVEAAIRNGNVEELLNMARRSFPAPNANRGRADSSRRKVENVKAKSQLKTPTKQTRSSKIQMEKSKSSPVPQKSSYPGYIGFSPNLFARLEARRTKNSKKNDTTTIITPKIRKVANQEAITFKTPQIISSHQDQTLEVESTTISNNHLIQTTLIGQNHKDSNTSLASFLSIFSWFDYSSSSERTFSSYFSLAACMFYYMF